MSGAAIATGRVTCVRITPFMQRYNSVGLGHFSVGNIILSVAVS